MLTSVVGASLELGVYVLPWASVLSLLASRRGSDVSALGLVEAERRAGRPVSGRYWGGDPALARRGRAMDSWDMPLRAVPGIPLIHTGDDLPATIATALAAGDILVVASRCNREILRGDRRSAASSITDLYLEDH